MLWSLLYYEIIKSASDVHVPILYPLLNRNAAIFAFYYFKSNHMIFLYDFIFSVRYLIYFINGSEFEIIIVLLMMAV